MRRMLIVLATIIALTSAIHTNQSCEKELIETNKKTSDLVLLELTNKNSNFRLSSSAFINEGTIPEKYTGDGEDVNPPLQWENAPASTKSFALICDDPDAPRGVWTHWLVKDIAASTLEIKENSILGEEVINSWKVKKWKGPKPPSGTHRYFFRLYALNTEKLDAGNLNDFYNKVQQYKIDEAVLMGKYSAKN